METRRLLAFSALLALASACGLAPEQPTATALGLEDHVRHLASTAPARDWSHPAHLLEIADYLGTQFEAAGARVEPQEFVVEGRTYRNVRAFPTT